MIRHHNSVELLGKSVFERVRFNPPIQKSDTMQNEACLLYAVKGVATLYGAEFKTTFSNHESVFMKCGNFTNHWVKNEDNEPYEAIAIHFYPDVVQYIFENNVPHFLNSTSTKGATLFQKIGRNDVITSFIESLKIYFDHPELFTEDTVKLKLRELITLLYQLNDQGIHELLSDLFNPYEVSFKKVIEAHIFEKLSIDELASLLHLSPSTFKRKFKEIYSISPGQYFLNKRLEKAAELLHYTDHSVTQICYDCGFGDLSNFTKVFSKKYGMNPSVFKKT